MYDPINKLKSNIMHIVSCFFLLVNKSCDVCCSCRVEGQHFFKNLHFDAKGLGFLNDWPLLVSTTTCVKQISTYCFNMVFGKMIFMVIGIFLQVSYSSIIKNTELKKMDAMKANLPRLRNFVVQEAVKDDSRVVKKEMEKSQNGTDTKTSSVRMNVMGVIDYVLGSFFCCGCWKYFEFCHKKYNNYDLYLFILNILL